MAIVATVQTGKAPLEVQFGTSTTGGSGSITSYFWSFGDGATSTEASPTHVYGAPGTFTVSLTVRDDQGATASATTTITVTAPARTFSELLVEPAEVTLRRIGQTQALSAIGVLPDGSRETVSSGVTWTSSNAAVARVSASGTVTGVAGGTAVITAQLGELSATASARVSISTSLGITPSLVVLEVGASRQFTVSRGAPPYAWSAQAGELSSTTGATVTYTAPNRPGVFTIRVSDADGLEESIDVTVVERLVARPAEATVLSGGTRVFTAEGGSPPYRWSVERGNLSSTRGGTTLYTAPAGTGRDTLRLTDEAGNERTVSITVARGLTLSPTQATAAPREAVELLIAGGVPPYTPSATCGTVRQPGADNVLVFTAPSGSETCTVQVEDSSGLVAQSFISIGAVLRLSPTEASLSPGTTQAFTVSGGAGPYAWSSEAGNLSAFSGRRVIFVAPQSAGSFAVTVRDSSGATAEARVAVTLPPGITPVTATLAPGAAQEFSVVNGSGAIAWTTTAGNLSATSGPTITYTAPLTIGTHTLSASDAAQNVVSATIFVVGNLIAPSPAVLTISPNETRLLTVTGGTGSYAWSAQRGHLSSTAGRSVAFTAATIVGDTFVEVTDTSGNQAFIKIEVTGALRLSPQSATLNPGQQVAFSVQRGEPPYGWSATAGRLNSTVGSQISYTAPAQPGFYQVVAADSAENTAVAAVTVANAGVAVTPARAEAESGDEVTFQARGVDETFRWRATAGGITQRERTSITYKAPEQAGDYELLVQDRQGNLSNVPVTVREPGGALRLSPATLELGVGEKGTFTAAGGSGSYLWELSDGTLGELSSTTGRSVAFEAGLRAGESTLRVRDAANAALATQAGISVQRQTRQGTKPVITMAGFGLTPLTYCADEGGTISMRAQVIDDDLTGMKVELFFDQESQFGSLAKQKFIDLTDADGDGLYEFSMAFGPGIPVGELLVPGLSLRATDRDGNVGTWPQFTVEAATSGAQPAIPATAAPDGTGSAPIIIMAGYGTTPLTYGSRTGGVARIQAQVVGGAAPLTVTSFLTVRNPLAGGTIKVPLFELQDLDGNHLYETVIPLQPGDLDTGEFNIDLSIEARDGAGNVAGWPGLGVVCESAETIPVTPFALP